VFYDWALRLTAAIPADALIALDDSAFHSCRHVIGLPIGQRVLEKLNVSTNCRNVTFELSSQMAYLLARERALA
jgi:hypothetical protein